MARKLEVLAERNASNEKHLDNLTLEECVIMHETGSEFLCEDGKIKKIYD